MIDDCGGDCVCWRNRARRMGIRARCDEELQVQTGLWLIVAEKRAEGWKKLLGISRTPDDNRANKFPLAIEYFFFLLFSLFQKVR